MSNFRPALLALAFAAIVAPTLIAQSPAAADLAKRTGKSKYTLGHLLMVRELSDGRVVATDSKEGLYRLVDFARGDVGILGTQGDEPGQYRRASQMINLPGDSIGMLDAANARVMHVSASGEIGPFSPMPRATRRLGTILGSDNSGALYFTTIPERDSVTKLPSFEQWVTRLPGDGKADEPMFRYRTRRAGIPMSGIAPYTFADVIAVRSDGVAARVVADSYQVVWYRDGKELSRTGLIPYTPVPLPLADQVIMRDSIAQAFKSMASSFGSSGDRPVTMSAAPGGASFGSGGGSGATMVFTSRGDGGPPAMVSSGTPMTMSMGPAGAAPAAGAATPGMANAAAAIASMNAADMVGAFPDAKPAIVSGFNSAMFDNSGMLWVMRERAHGDVVPHYDVIAEGRGVVGHVNLPAGTRLVGFGKGTVYVARADAGSDWLERYPMPKL